MILWQSGRYPFLDTGILRCDWLKSKPKQSKFGRELLEMKKKTFFTTAPAIISYFARKGELLFTNSDQIEADDYANFQ